MGKPEEHDLLSTQYEIFKTFITGRIFLYVQILFFYLDDFTFTYIILAVKSKTYDVRFVVAAALLLWIWAFWDEV
jgi:hypothetical protein